MFKNTTTTITLALFALVTTLMLVTFAVPAYAVSWMESPDAGDLTGTAQVTSGTEGESLTTINGTIANNRDVDLYKIRIVSPSIFSASTSGGDAPPFDAVLALFDAQGLGIYLNDDSALNVGDSRLPSPPPLGPSSPGTYYLAIFDDDMLPFSGAGASENDLIFPIPPPPYTDVLGPTATGGSLPLNGWATLDGTVSLNAGYQIFLTGAEPAESIPSNLVDLTGTVQDTGGTPLCSMVLASGQFMFTCNPNGPFSLLDLPRETNDTVKRQVYVDGFFPVIDVLTGSSTDETVIMTRSGTCPNYNTPYEAGVFPGSAGKRIGISGTILLQDTTTPVCAMVLANGQFMFSCDGSGNYALNIPLDNNGQFKLQVYADGFAPNIQRFDEFSANNDVHMARAMECQ